MPIVPVPSIDDPRLDDYRNVPDHDLLAARGLFIAEGRLVVRRLLESDRFVTRSVLLTPAALASLDDCRERLAGLPVYVVEQAAMNAIAGFDIHRGCLAAGERRPALDWRGITASARTVVVLEQVGNADNVGGVFRNAAAFAADGVLLGPSCADPLYRKAIRTSMGATLRVPFAAMPDWPADLRRLHDAGFTIVALSTAGDVPIGEARLASPGRVALLVGHEGSGLSDDAMQAADVRVKITMAEGVDSLNVATAAAIALYERSRM